MKKTLYAIIIALSVLTLFISCNGNQDVVTYTVTVKDGDDVYKKKEVASGDIYVLPAKPKDSTCPFKGWEIGESTELMQPGEDLTITGDTEITAVWVTSCTVSFDLRAPELKEIETFSVEYGTALSSLPSAPDRTGYAFDGWYLNEKKYESGTALVKEDITLIAHWTTKYYTVFFNTDGGEAMSSLKVPYDETIKSVTQTPVVPVKAGYTFDKWTYENNGADFSYEDSITSDTYLKAEWKINEYTVSFDLGDENLDVIENMTAKYGEIKDSPSVPHRTGYVFSAWKIRNGGIFDFRNPITGDLELEAVWTEIKTNLTVYFPKNVNDVETIKVDVGGVERTFSYSEGDEEGDYKKYTAEVTGLDHGTYDITLTTFNGNNRVGGSYTDSVNMKYDITDKEVKVDTSNVVDISTSVSGTVQAATISGDAENGYVISGTAKLSCGDGYTVLYSNDGNEPSDSYNEGDSITVTNKLRLKATLTDSSKWSKGSVNSTVSFNTIGATGPAGGIIFYDENTVKQDSYTDSTGATATYKWRFFEAAAADLEKCSVGPKGKKFATSTAIGKGKSNTELLKGQSSAADYAADLCAKHSVTVGEVEYDDWFLPSKNELIAMLETNTVTKIMSTGVWYASSSVSGTDYVEVALITSAGKVEKGGSQYRDYSNLGVRPVRCF